MATLSDLMGRLSGKLLVHGSVSFFLEFLRRPHVRNDDRVKLRLLPTRCRRSGATVWGSGVRGKPLISLFSFTLTLQSRQLMDNKECGQQKKELDFAAEIIAGNGCGELIARF